MHKELIISLIIIALVVILNVITQNYTKECVEKINIQLESLKEAMVEKSLDKEEMYQKVDQITNDWNQMHEKLSYYIEHDELEKVDTELTSLQASILVEEYEQGIPELEKCKFILKHIKHKEAFKIENLF